MAPPSPLPNLRPKIGNTSDHEIFQINSIPYACNMFIIAVSQDCCFHDAINALQAIWSTLVSEWVRVSGLMFLHLPDSRACFLTLSDAGVWRLNRGRGGAPKAPPPIRGTFSTPDPKNGSQPHNSPRLRCYNIKRPQKLRAMCWNWQLFVPVILPSYCSRQGPPLWN